MAEPTNAAMETAKEAEKNVEVQVDKIVESKYGKKMPLEIKKLTLSQLLWITFVLKITYFLADFLIIKIANEPASKSTKWIVSFFKSFYSIILIFDLGFEAVVFLLGLKGMLAFAIISSITKNIVVSVVLLMYMLKSFSLLLFSSFILFIAVTLGFDTSFLFYLSLSFKANDAKTEEVEEEKV